MIKTLINRIKLFSSPRKEFYLFLKSLLGVTPGNLKLYDTAFIHKSSSLTNEHGHVINNERLEYLGDAILGSIVAEYLYNRFPHKGEGFLTQMRSRLVNRVFLSQLTYDMGLHQFVVSRSALTSTSSHIYGDAFEALIGAIYIDHGYDVTKRVVIKNIISKFVDLEKLELEDTNYKSQLIEFGQKNKAHVEFTTDVKEVNNRNVFVTSLTIFDKQVGTGQGQSKKISQQNAAKQAAMNLDTIDVDQLRQAYEDRLRKDAEEANNKSNITEEVANDSELSEVSDQETYETQDMSLETACLKSEPTELNHDVELEIPFEETSADDLDCDDSLTVDNDNVITEVEDEIIEIQPIESKKDISEDSPIDTTLPDNE